MTALLVALGACVGAPARYLVGRALPSLPATLLVNLLGSLAVGLFAGLGPSPYALLGIGLCGAFTTYSAFAVEAVTLPRPAGCGLRRCQRGRLLPGLRSRARAHLTPRVRSASPSSRQVVQASWGTAPTER